MDHGRSRVGRFAYGLALAITLACLASPSFAQSGLTLPFDGSLVGTRGQTPSSASGVTFDTGKVNQAVVFNAGDVLEYPSDTNIDPEEGTLELWYRPNWNPGTGNAYVLCLYNGGGGMMFVVDGGPNLRAIFNCWSPDQVNVITNVSNWRAGEWHHVAFTWSNSQAMLCLYVDGALKDHWHLTSPLKNTTDPTIRVGSNGLVQDANGAIDEFAISTRAKSAGEILNSYLSTVGMTGLAFQPENLTLWKTWWRKPRLFAETPAGSVELPHDAYALTSTDPAVASIRADNYIVANNGGTCDISTTFGGLSATMHVTVRTPVLPEQNEAIDPVLSTPMPGYIWEMPVVIVQFIPTADGTMVDQECIGPDGSWVSVAMARDWIDKFNKRVKFGLEERSRFRGYKRPEARPSLGYRVVKIVTFYEPMPPYMEFMPDHEWHQPDYDQILRRINAEYWVKQHNVKEFWVWGYHYAGIAPVESNMSSPTTGDVSNSYRINDLPVFDRTYTVYGYNFMRTQSEALHNHGHQIEAILSHVAWMQDGSSDLFWVNFAGYIPGVGMGTGRAGACHFPPNTNIDYDYMNPTLVSSDCEDWTPDNTGARTMVNVDTWANLTYQWPGGSEFWQRTDAQYYIYWWQNMPGWDNGIRYGASEEMTNWWKFTGDWDGSIARLATEGGLHGPKVAAWTAMSVNPAAGKPGDSVELRATLTKRSDGSGVGSKSVGFKIDGTSVGAADTSSAGVATLAYTVAGLGAGGHEISAQFAGDSSHATSSGTAILTVTISDTTLWTIPRSGIITEAVNLRAYDLKRTTDGALLSGKTIVFKIDGTAVGTGTTDSGGDASYAWTITEGPASRTITTAFEGDASYNASSANATLTCQAWTTKMVTFNRTARITDRTELKARLLRSDNAPIYGKTIGFSIDGTFIINRTTNVDGYASYPYYDVPDGAGAGARTILCEWPGNAGYAGISKTAVLDVKKAIAYIWVLSKSVKQGGIANLYAYFRRLYDYKKQEGKPVTFRIDGTWIADVTTGSGAVDPGVARHLYPTAGLGVGAHTIRCEFAGDAWLDAGYGEGTLTIL